MVNAKKITRRWVVGKSAWAIYSDGTLKATIAIIVVQLFKWVHTMHT